MDLKCCLMAYIIGLLEIGRRYTNFYHQPFVYVCLVCLCYPSGRGFLPNQIMKITTNITNRATRRELVPHSSWRKPAAKGSIISVGEQDADGDKLLLEDVQQIQQHQQQVSGIGPRFQQLQASLEEEREGILESHTRSLRSLSFSRKQLSQPAHAQVPSKFC